MPWSSSRRRQSLPKDWARRVREVKTRAQGRCEWVDNGQRCTRPGVDTDHANNPADHSLANLQLLCRQHHDAKTQAESLQAKGHGPLRKRPPEPHPGLQ